MLNAVYKQEPHCPKCHQALATPEWWQRVEQREHAWTDAVQVFCDRCKQVVLARFFVGGREF